MGRLAWILAFVAQIILVAGLFSEFCGSYVIALRGSPCFSGGVLLVLYGPLAFAQWRLLRTAVPKAMWLNLTFLTGLANFLCVLIVIQINFELDHFPMKEVVEQWHQERVVDEGFDQWAKDTVSKRKAERRLVLLILMSTAVLYGSSLRKGRSRVM